MALFYEVSGTIHWNVLSEKVDVIFVDLEKGLLGGVKPLNLVELKKSLLEFKII